MPDILDIFGSDAFGVIPLTEAVNKMPFVPGRIGQLEIFQTEGSAFTKIAIEEQNGKLVLIPTAARGGVAPKHTPNKRTARVLAIPHIPYDASIAADEVQGVRAFGSNSELMGVEQLVNARLADMMASHDATLEYHRIGAIKGLILDADGSTIYDLFEEFGVSQESEVDFDLDNASPAAGIVRKKISAVQRLIEDNLEMGAGTYSYIHAIVGSAFFDDLVAHKEVTDAYTRWVLNGQMGEFMRMQMARRSFYYAGVLFEEYRGKVGAVNFVDTNKAHFFPVGVPGLFKTVFGPADWGETVNTVGLPRYAKIIRDDPKNRVVQIATQQNPLNYCTRPKVLVLGKR